MEEYMDIEYETGEQVAGHKKRSDIMMLSKEKVSKYELDELFAM